MSICANILKRSVVKTVTANANAHPTSVCIGMVFPIDKKNKLRNRIIFFLPHFLIIYQN